MYPLKHKLISAAFLMAALIALLIFPKGIFSSALSPYIFTIFAVAIIISAITFGVYAIWACFAISAMAVYLTSLAASSAYHNLQSLVFLGIAASCYAYSKKNSRILRKGAFIIEKTREATNIIKAKKAEADELNAALSQRLDKYRSLRQIGESFSAKLSLDEIYQLGVDTAYSAITGSDAALLFMADEIEQKLILCASKKSSKMPAIKSKKGDIFDKWVFKERQPLNVEDAEEDFRFDYKPIEGESGEREFRSLISAPLISQERIIGILRLNSINKNAYTFDDLRLLDFISDMLSSAVKNARLYKTTEELSIKDSLTGCYVQRYFKERIKEEVERSKASERALSLIMIDIDHFKNYNDRYGHAAGDSVLSGISKIINDKAQEGIVCRYGGEEFAVLLPGVNIEEAAKRAEGIRENLSLTKFMLRRQETSVTISAGVASCAGGVKNADDLIEAADFCLYKAKREGRNRICVV